MSTALTEVLELRDAPDRDPVQHVKISGSVPTRTVRSDELPIDPLIPRHAVVRSLLGIWVVPQVGDQPVVLVEDRNAPRKVGDRQVRPPLVHVAGAPQFLGHHAYKLAVEAEELQAIVLAVRYGEERFLAAGIKPDAVGRAHLSRVGPFAAPTADVLPFGVVLVNPTQPVTVAHIDVPARTYGDTGRFVF